MGEQRTRKPPEITPTPRGKARPGGQLHGGKRGRRMQRIKNYQLFRVWAQYLHTDQDYLDIFVTTPQGTWKNRGAIAPSKVPPWKDRAKRPSQPATGTLKARRATRMGRKTAALGLAMVTMMFTSWCFSMPVYAWPSPTLGEAPPDTRLYLQLTNAQIMAWPNNSYTFWATNHCIMRMEVTGASHVNFTLGDQRNPPEEYIATAGENTWGVRFDPQDWGDGNGTAPDPRGRGCDWYNVTFDESSKKYIQSFAIQPVILAGGNCTLGASDHYDISFLAAGRVVLLLWTVVDFGRLAVSVDGIALKEADTTAWNISAAEITVLQGGTALKLATEVDPGNHTLRLAGGPSNMTYCLASDYDYDADGLSTGDELQHAYDLNTSPLFPDIWAKETKIIENATGVIDAFNLTVLEHEELWQRNSLEIHVGGAFYDTTTYLFADAFYGTFTDFEVGSDNGLMFGDRVIEGWYTMETKVISVMDESGKVHTGPACDFVKMQSICFGELNPGVTTVNYKALVDPFRVPEIRFRTADRDVVIWETEQIAAPELDSDGDGVTDIMDLSPSTCLPWFPNEIHQLVCPVGESAELTFQVVRPPHDKSTTTAIEWHAGEIGSKKCQVVPALRLFFEGNPNASDYWYQDQNFASFWGEDGVDRKIVTWNLVDLNKNGTAYNATMDLEPSTTADEDAYYTLVFPTTKGNTWEFTAAWGSGHLALADNILSVYWDLCYAVVTEDWNNGTADILHIYDFNYASDPAEWENVTVAGVKLAEYDDVNALAASPNDYVTTKALEALNRNPALAGSGEFDWDQEISDAILCNYAGIAYSAAYNYNISDPTTWSAAERLTHGAYTYAQEPREMVDNFAETPAGQHPAFWGGDGTIEGTWHSLALADESTTGATGTYRSFNGTIYEGSLEWDFRAHWTAGGDPIWAGIAETGNDLATISARWANNQHELWYGTTSLGAMAADTWHVLKMDFFANQTTRIYLNGAYKGTFNFTAEGFPNEMAFHAGTSEDGVTGYIRNVHLTWDQTVAHPKYTGNYVEFFTLTEKTSDLLQKLVLGTKVDLSTGAEYVPYNATYDFFGVTPGTNLEACGWTTVSNSTGTATIVRYKDTHASVARLESYVAPTNWIGATHTFTPQQNATIEWWFQADLATSPVMSMLFGPADNPNIELRVEDERLYYRNSTAALVEIGDVVAGAWYHASLTFNCSGTASAFEIALSGASFASLDNCSFRAGCTAIDKISFKAEGGIAYFDSVGCWWEEEYKGNYIGLDEIKGADTCQRLSFYRVKDVYNGTVAPGDPELEGEDGVLYETTWNAMFGDHAETTVYGIPVRVQLVRSNDSTVADGWEGQDYLVITTAAGPCLPDDLPWDMGAAGGNVQFLDIEIAEVINEYSADALRDLPAHLAFSVVEGDTIKVETSEDQPPSIPGIPIWILCTPVAGVALWKYSTAGKAILQVYKSFIQAERKQLKDTLSNVKKVWKAFQVKAHAMGLENPSFSWEIKMPGDALFTIPLDRNMPRDLIQVGTDGYLSFTYTYKDLEEAMKWHIASLENLLEIMDMPNGISKFHGEDILQKKWVEFKLGAQSLLNGKSVKIVNPDGTISESITLSGSLDDMRQILKEATDEDMLKLPNEAFREIQPWEKTARTMLRQYPVTIDVEWKITALYQWEYCKFNGWKYYTPRTFFPDNKGRSDFFNMAYDHPTFHTIDPVIDATTQEILPHEFFQFDCIGIMTDHSQIMSDFLTFQLFAGRNSFERSIHIMDSMFLAAKAKGIPNAEQILWCSDIFKYIDTMKVIDSVTLRSVPSRSRMSGILDDLTLTDRIKEFIPKWSGKSFSGYGTAMKYWVYLGPGDFGKNPKESLKYMNRIESGELLQYFDKYNSRVAEVTEMIGVLSSKKTSFKMNAKLFPPDYVKYTQKSSRLTFPECNIQEISKLRDGYRQYTLQTLKLGETNILDAVADVDRNINEICFQIQILVNHVVYAIQTGTLTTSQKLQIVSTMRRWLELYGGPNAQNPALASDALRKLHPAFPDAADLAELFPNGDALPHVWPVYIERLIRNKHCFGAGTVFLTEDKAIRRELNNIADIALRTAKNKQIKKELGFQTMADVDAAIKDLGLPPKDPRFDLAGTFKDGNTVNLNRLDWYERAKYRYLQELREASTESLPWERTLSTVPWMSLIDDVSGREFGNYKTSQYLLRSFGGLSWANDPTISNFDALKEYRKTLLQLRNSRESHSGKKLTSRIYLAPEDGDLWKIIQEIDPFEGMGIDPFITLDTKGLFCAVILGSGKYDIDRVALAGMTVKQEQPLRFIVTQGGGGYSMQDLCGHVKTQSELDLDITSIKIKIAFNELARKPIPMKTVADRIKLQKLLLEERIYYQQYRLMRETVEEWSTEALVEATMDVSDLPGGDDLYRTVNGILTEGTNLGRVITKTLRQKLLGNLPSALIGLLMDIICDIPNMIQEVNELTAKGWSQDQAIWYALAHYGPEWIIEFCADMIIAATIGGGAAGTAAGIVASVVISVIYELLWNQCVQYEADWRTDLMPYFAPVLVIPDATNRSLAKHLSLAVGDVIQVNTTIKNNGSLRYMDQWPNLVISPPESNETGAPFWMRARYAFEAEDATPTWSGGWNGWWNEYINGTWLLSDRNPLVGNNTYMNGETCVWDWNGGSYGASGAKTFTHEITLENAVPQAWWHMEQQYASTFQMCTPHPAIYQKVPLDGVFVVERNLTEFLTASTPIEEDGGIFDSFLRFYSAMNSGNWSAAWDVGQNLLGEVNAELLWGNETDFAAMKDRTIALDGEDAPVGYWRATDTRYVPFTVEEQENYVLLNCADVAEFQSYFQNVAGSATRFMDYAVRAVIPAWKYAGETSYLWDDFNYMNFTTFPIPGQWIIETGNETSCQFLVESEDGRKPAYAYDLDREHQVAAYLPFNPASSGTAQWVGKFNLCHPNIEVPQTLTCGLVYKNGSTVVDVATFTLHNTTTTDGEVLFNGHSTGNVLSVDNLYTFQVDWDYTRGNAASGKNTTVKFYIEGIQFLASDTEFLSDCIPNAFVVRTGIEGVSCMWVDDFHIRVNGPPYEGYHTANYAAANQALGSPQVLIPKALLTYQEWLYDLQDDVQYALNHEIPIRTGIAVVPAWDGLLTFYPGETGTGCLDFAVSGPDNPEVVVELGVPAGFSIAPAERTYSLQHLPGVDNEPLLPFGISAAGSALAGVYTLDVAVRYACNDTYIFADTILFRYGYNASFRLETWPFPVLSAFGNGSVFGTLYNTGNGPLWSDLTVDGVPTDWLHARGYYENDLNVTWADTFDGGAWHLFEGTTDISEERFLTPWETVTADTYVSAQYPASDYGGYATMTASGSPEQWVLLSYPFPDRIIAGASGTLRLYSATTLGANRHLVAYTCGSFLEGNGPSGQPPVLGTSWDTRPDIYAQLGDFTANATAGGFADVVISTKGSSVVLRPYTAADSATFYARDGTYAPQVRFNCTAFNQANGQVHAQVGSGTRTVKLVSPTYNNPTPLQPGDKLRVTFTARTASEVTLKLTWLGLTFTEVVLAPAGNEDSRTRTLEFALPVGINDITKFNEIAIMAILNGTANESLVVHDIRVVRPCILPESSPLHVESFTMDPTQSSATAQLWTLAGTSQAWFVVDWAGASQDTYVDEASPRCNYAAAQALLATGTSPLKAILVSRAPSGYLETNLTVDFRAWASGASNGTERILFYDASEYIAEWVTWRHAPSLGGLVGNTTVAAGWDEFHLNSTGEHFWILTSDDWINGTSFASLEDVARAPQFLLNLSKYWCGNGLAYMQTNTTETLTLQSPEFAQDITLTDDDWVYCRFAANTSAAVELRLLHEGNLQATLVLKPAGTRAADMRWQFFNLTTGAVVDQLEVRASLSAGDYVAVDEISLERPDIYDFINASVGGVYKESVSLQGDIVDIMGGHRDVQNFTNAAGPVESLYDLGTIPANGTTEFWSYVPPAVPATAVASYPASFGFDDLAGLPAGWITYAPASCNVSVIPSWAGHTGVVDIQDGNSGDRAMLSYTPEAPMTNSIEFWVLPNTTYYTYFTIYGSGTTVTHGCLQPEAGIIYINSLNDAWYTVYTGVTARWMHLRFEFVFATHVIKVGVDDLLRGEYPMRYGTPSSWNQVCLYTFASGIGHSYVDAFGIIGSANYTRGDNLAGHAYPASFGFDDLAALPPGWTDNSGTACNVTVTATLANHTGVAQLHDGGSSYAMATYGAPSYMESNIEYWVYPGTYTYWALYGGGKTVTYGYLQSGANMYINVVNDGWYTVCTGITSRWYHVRFSFDWTNKKVTVAVDDVVRGTWAFRDTTATYWSQLNLCTAGGFGSGDSYIDAVGIIGYGGYQQRANLLPVPLFRPLASMSVAANGTAGQAQLKLRDGVLCAANDTGGVVPAWVDVARAWTGWNHVSLTLHGDGNYSVWVNNAPAATCRLWNAPGGYGGNWTSLRYSLLGPCFVGNQTYFLDAIGSTGVAGYAAGDNLNQTLLSGSVSFNTLLPGHWLEYFLEVPREWTSPPGNYTLFASFTDPVTGSLAAIISGSTYVPSFYDTAFVNTTALSMRDPGAVQFVYAANLTNLGNIVQDFSLTTTLSSNATATFYPNASLVTPITGVELQPGEMTSIWVKVEPAGHYRETFEIMAYSGYNLASLAATFDTDIPPAVTSTPMEPYIEWSTSAPAINWTFADTYAPGATYTVDCDGSYYSNGTWVPDEPTLVSLDDLVALGEASLGVHEFTIVAGDGWSGTNTSTAWVNLTNFDPLAVNRPADRTIQWLDTGHEITWCVLDNSLLGGTYTVYRNGTSWATGYWNHSVAFAIDINSSTLAIGHYNFSIVIEDGLGGTLHDAVTIAVINAPPAIAGSPEFAHEYNTGGTLQWVVNDISALGGTYMLYLGGIVDASGALVDQDATAPGIQMVISVDLGATRWRNLENITTYTFFLVASDGALNASFNTTLAIINGQVPTFAEAPDAVGCGHAALDFEWNPRARGEGPYALSWVFHDESTSSAGYQLYLNGHPWGTGGTWANGTRLTVDVSNLNMTGIIPGVENKTTGRNNVTLKAWDGLGAFTSISHFVDVVNYGPAIKLVEEPAWIQDTLAVDTYLRWEVTDGSVGASNGTARVERSKQVGDDAWSSWEIVATGLSFANGTTQLAYNLKANISSTGAGLWRYQLVACDNVPGGAVEASCNVSQRAEVDVNAAPTVTGPASASYNSFSSKKITWTIQDAHLVNANASYWIYKTGVTNPIKSGNWSQEYNQPYIYCSDDWVSFNSASRTLDYWIVVDDGYQRTAEILVSVTVLRSRENQFNQWTQQAWNGKISANQWYTYACLSTNWWWMPAQDWWSSPVQYQAPRMYTNVPSGNWWAVVRKPESTGLMHHTGLLLHQDESNVAFWGYMEIEAGYNFGIGRLERIDNGVGHYNGDAGTWSTDPMTLVTENDLLAIKCWQNTYAFGCYDANHMQWHWSSYISATTLGVTPAHIGFFLKEWNNNLVEPEIYSWFHDFDMGALGAP